MRIKSFKTLLIVAIVLLIGFLPVIFFVDIGGKTVSQTPLQEPSITLNELISDAVTVYATAAYRQYSREELQKYFINEIVEDILKGYEPFEALGEETAIEFEEQPFPEIGLIDIRFDAGEYAVKLQFGEVYYNYRLTVTPNRIITKIIDGGMTFD